MGLTDMRKKRATLAAEAKKIADAVKAGARDMTPAEMKAFDDAYAEIERLDAQIKTAEETIQRMEQLGEVFGPDPQEPRRHVTGGVDDRKGYLQPGSKGSFNGIMSKVRDNGGGASGVKSLIDSVDVLEPVMVQDSPIAMGVPASTIFDLVPGRRVPRDYSYLRQTTRDNRAAPVAPGDLKPTSTYRLQRVENRLKVIAHMSEPMFIYDLADNENLTRFLSNEMRYGLFLGIENQFFNGDGTGENFHGLAHTSGVQVQTYKTNAILTLRAAITALETAGYTPDGMFLNPSDWEAIETSQYLLNDTSTSPVDRAARRLWGVPVGVSNAVAAGTGWVKSEGSLVVSTDEQGVQATWGVQGDDFSRNQIRARFEGRFELDTLAPAGIVKATITGA